MFVLYYHYISTDKRVPLNHVIINNNIYINGIGNKDKGLPGIVTDIFDVIDDDDTGFVVSEDDNNDDELF